MRQTPKMWSIQPPPPVHHCLDPRGPRLDKIPDTALLLPHTTYHGSSEINRVCQDYLPNDLRPNGLIPCRAHQELRLQNYTEKVYNNQASVLRRFIRSQL
ncbi:hypothetical protein M8J77_015947 [Diaphorina citri]|nr:hypothetical protein M8J77_015947 [Diaphorina citri]